MHGLPTINTPDISPSVRTHTSIGTRVFYDNIPGPGGSLVELDYAILTPVVPVITGGPASVFGWVFDDATQSCLDAPELHVDVVPHLRIMNSEDGFHFAMSGVPEASTWAMLLIGFASIGFIAYQRRRSPLIAARDRIAS